jgi:hypothetical protein
MCSFFIAIILFIASELVEYGGNQAIKASDHGNTSAVFPLALVILLGLLIGFQAPVNIAKAPGLSCLQHGFMNENPTKEQKRYLNWCAAGAFLIEVVLATRLICFGLYEELLPISACVDLEAVKLFPWIIIMCSCVVGYGVGFVFNFWQYLSDSDFVSKKETNDPVV